MSLNPRLVLGTLDLTDYPFALEEGSDLGDAVNVTDVLASLLADGEIESLARRSNRTLTIPILIEGGDLGLLADAEAALVAECDKQRNTLTFDPGDGFGKPSVFDTFTAQATRTYSDATEVAGYRRWTLTIRALPYARSVDSIIDDAGTPPSSGGTLLYNCESTSGWSKWGLANGSGNGTTIAVDSVIYTQGAGSVRANAESGYTPDSLHWSFESKDQVTGLSLSTGAGGYLSISVRTGYTEVGVGGASRLFRLWTTVGGVETEVTDFFATALDANGFTDYVWPVAAGQTVTKIRTHTIQNATSASVDVTQALTWYDDVQLLAAATTDHQIVKQLTVKGSARTTASLRVASPTPTVALGQVLAVTVPTSAIPSGFQPDGRRWVSQGTTTPDATALWGSYYTPTTSYSSAATFPIFDVPNEMLIAGPYTIVALVKATGSSLNFGVQAQLRVGSTNVGPTWAAEVSPTGLTAGWQLITVGTVYLPPLPVQNADATTKVRLLFKGALFSDIYMIPAWQVGGRPVADFSIVDCGTGTVSSALASSSLWIESPTPEQPQGGWWRGPTVDRANARSAWPDAKKPGVHTFNPGSLTAFLVSTDAAGPTLALEYYPAWLGSAAI